ncbi:hypothetical protein Hypma_014209 [Hypsizygus marmoreus]|uniref:F-box domain-containing protein n=1 Tax=Hypsizygus marmoreus TaxID=39966 RepID=A0A369JAM3_HYPMA|nr:hypothetical protein Hypma_014209 [Hypsizygus marmoreus]
MLDYLPETTEDLILSVLRPADLLRYAKVSSTTYALTHSYIKRAFSISKLLLPFFSELEVADFRSLQSKTGMLISGDLALEFFGRLPPSNSPLEVYVEHHFSFEIGRWFMHMGYEFVAQDNRCDDFKAAYIGTGALWNAESSMHVSTAHVFLFEFHSKAKKKSIFIRTMGGSPMEAILNFHSSPSIRFHSIEKD